MVFFFSVLSSSLIFFNAEAKKVSNEVCHALSNKLNQRGAMVIDEITTLTNTVCIRGQFIYSYEISEDITPRDFENILKSEMKPEVITSFCTDPSTRPFLDAVHSVTLRYRRSDGDYLGEFSFDNSDC